MSDQDVAADEEPRGSAHPSKTTTNKNDDNEVATTTKWTDDQIRWENVDDEKNDDDDDEAPEDPFKVDGRKQFTFEFDSNITVKLKGYAYESDEVWKSTGLTIWRAAEYLCTYLVEHWDSLVETTHCEQLLELGSGLGLCGIVAYQLARRRKSQNVVKEIMITDGDSDALVYLRNNVRDNANQQTNERSSNSSQDDEARASTVPVHVSAQQLIWGKESSIKFQQHFCQRRCLTKQIEAELTETTNYNNHLSEDEKTQQQPPLTQEDFEPYQLIIASDIIYSKVIIEPLWETLDTLLCPQHGIFIMAFALRDGIPVTIDDLIQAGEEKYGFTSKCIQQNSKGDLFIYQFQRQSSTNSSTTT